MHESQVFLMVQLWIPTFRLNLVSILLRISS